MVETLEQVDIQFSGIAELPPMESGDHLVLFEKPPPARATWTHGGSIASLDEEGAELVLVGAKADDIAA